MSNPIAIAAVTAVLKDLLEKGVASAGLEAIVGGDVKVSALPPDRIEPNNGEDPNRLNLFLYQVTPNQSWRNVGLPSRNGDGQRINNQPLAINLHYLLTAYGTKDFYSEILLGHAMHWLHETGVLTRDAIRKALAPAAPPPDFPTKLATSELADQVEQLKITPETLNTEEVSKLWSAIQAHYRPTVAYQVTVVLIEGRRSAQNALPVSGRNIVVLPLNGPVIDNVSSADGDSAPIVAKSTLRVRGRSLRSDRTQVWITGHDLSAAISDLTSTEILVTFPDPLPAGLYAGVQTVQVTHPIAMGTPPAAHRGLESNIEAFILRPTIAASVESAVDSVIGGVVHKSGEIKVSFVPRVRQTQRVVMLLNEFDPPGTRHARAYSFPSPTGNGVAAVDVDTGSIKIPYTNVLPGTYLVRARVDGAESQLDVDAQGRFAKPQLTIA